jgi:hypothetical protein
MSYIIRHDLFVTLSVHFLVHCCRKITLMSAHASIVGCFRKSAIVLYRMIRNIRLLAETHGYVRDNSTVLVSRAIFNRNTSCDFTEIAELLRLVQFCELFRLNVEWKGFETKFYISFLPNSRKLSSRSLRLYSLTGIDILILLNI